MHLALKPKMDYPVRVQLSESSSALPVRKNLATVCSLGKKPMLVVILNYKYLLKLKIIFVCSVTLPTCHNIQLYMLLLHCSLAELSLHNLSQLPTDSRVFSLATV